MVTPCGNPVFVLACGPRSGSTLIQRLLNSCPDVLIWGEHAGYLTDIVDSLSKLMDWEAQFSRSRTGFIEGGYDQFLPNMVPHENELWEAAAVHIRALFGQPAASLGRSIWGFKEVRYGADVAVFLQRCFPEARFIHLTRDVVDIVASLTDWEQSPDPWNREWTECAIQDWQRINASFLVEHGIGKLLSVRYEDVTANPSAFLDELERFLDLPRATLDETVFERVMTSDGYGGVRTQRLARPRSAVDAGARSLLSSDEMHRVAAAYGYSISFEALSPGRA